MPIFANIRLAVKLFIVASGGKKNKKRALFEMIKRISIKIVLIVVGQATFALLLTHSYRSAVAD